MTDGQFLEMRAALARLAWLAPWLRWSVCLANSGRAGVLRLLPLRACAWLVQVGVWGARRGLWWGYGGCAPHGDQVQPGGDLLRGKGGALPGSHSRLGDKELRN